MAGQPKGRQHRREARAARRLIARAYRSARSEDYGAEKSKPLAGLDSALRLVAGFAGLVRWVSAAQPSIEAANPSTKPHSQPPDLGRGGPPCRILALCNVAVKGGMRPILSRSDIVVPDGIKVNIVHVLRIIDFVPHRMFPVSPLPDTSFAFVPPTL